MQNRRHFTRVLFKHPATVTHNGHTLDARILDLSFKGVLLELANPEPISIGDSVFVSINLNQHIESIEVKATVVYCQNDHIGLQNRTLDLDSASQLKRLIALNLGDDKLLNRELAELATPSTMADE